MEIIRKAVVVHGLVQGVSFRYFTYEVAQETGVSGWVKNLDNGDVQIEVQGESSNLDVFLQRIKTGPRLAHVEHLDITEITPVKNEEGFLIKY